ncbi:chloride channel protein [Tenacibaculum sp. 190524A05c]|uniref:Chloride channel protein, CIC family n=1 Tax=Tenacibaculum platacis TaxID=3137852 RepID=A0ABP1EII5_9FLAO
MLISKKTLKRILIWRYKNVSERQFVYVLSILVGFLAGLGTLVLKNLTYFFQWILEGNLIKDYHYSFYFLFPIIGLLLVHIIKKYLLKKEIGHGISTTLEAISKKSGIIEQYKIYASVLTAPITAGFGGSIGLQGPAVSTGAALGSGISQLFHVNTKTRMLLIACAAAGAMASMFQAPIAAIIFAIEIFSLDLAFVSLIPLLLASVSAIVTSYFFLGQDVLFSVKIQETFQINDIAFYVFLAIFTGFASVYFSKIYFIIINFFNRFKKTSHKLFWSSIAIGLLLLLVPPLYGEGYSIINNLLLNDAAEALKELPYKFDKNNVWTVIILLMIVGVLKVIAMTTTFAAGGVGGIFIPTLVMGSILGNVLAKTINAFGFSVSETNFTLIGMTGLMAGVLHAPLTAIFLIAEITGGYDLFVPLMLVAAVSYAITKYFVSNSIYAVELAERGELITHDRDKNVMMMMSIEKIIEKNFISVSLEMSMRQLLTTAVTKSNRNIFPVLNENNEFLGIILLDDIRPILFDEKLYDKLTVLDFMKSAPTVIFNTDSIEKIMQKFKESGAWNLPIVKEDGTYIGFISKSKLLSAYRSKLLQVTS